MNWDSTTGPVMVQWCSHVITKDGKADGNGLVISAGLNSFDGDEKLCCPLAAVFALFLRNKATAPGYRTAKQSGFKMVQRFQRAISMVKVPC